MILRFRHLSIKHKLMLVMMALGLCALTLAGACMLFIRYHELQRRTAQQTGIIADMIVGSTSAALANNDPIAAQRVLDVLRGNQDVVKALIFGKDKKVFAGYIRDKKSFDVSEVRSEQTSVLSDKDDIRTARQIIFEGASIGRLIIETDLEQFQADVHDLVFIVLDLVCLALFMLLILYSYFQNVVARPILALANLTRAVSETGNYSVRAEVKTGDEIGALSLGLNRMLTEVEKRERALHRAHQTLEERVLGRTEELEEEVAIRKAVETALRREQEMFQGVISNAPVAMAMLDSSMRYVAHSNYWLTDYEINGSIIGKSHYDVFPDIPERWRVIHRRALAGEIITCAEDIFERTDGQKLYLRWALHPWWKSDGSQGGVIIVTDRIDDLVRGREEALSSAQAKAQFFANVSHELRTPMNGILGFTELLFDSELSADQRTHLDVIKSSARYLLSLIDDILDFAKIESTQFELEQVNFELIASLNNVATLLRPVAERKGIELRLKFDSSLPELVYGDSLRVQQVFFNLIGNAIKFTQAGYVEVEARAERNADGNIILRAVVRDSGIGIPPDKIATIFDVFAQVDGSTTRKYGGTGLGLAICLQLIGLMKGKIEVKSELGEGSEFLFSLELAQEIPDAPIVSAQRRDGERSRPRSIGPRKSIQILVAEDNAVNQKLLSVILKKHGFELTMVETGAEALSIAKEKAFDLILMDLQMPELGGIDACKLIRDGQAPLNTKTPIIALTANSFEEDHLRCLAAGMDGYLSKPIQKEVLLETIQLWVAASAPGQRID